MRCNWCGRELTSRDAKFEDKTDGILGWRIYCSQGCVNSARLAKAPAQATQQNQEDTGCGTKAIIAGLIASFFLSPSMIFIWLFDLQNENSNAFFTAFGSKGAWIGSLIFWVIVVGGSYALHKHLQTQAFNRQLNNYKPSSNDQTMTSNETIISNQNSSSTITICPNCNYNVGELVKKCPNCNSVIR